MRVTIYAVGRLRAGPEKMLVEDYLDRAGKAGRGLGLGPFEVSEIDERKGGSKAGEAALLRKAIPENAKICVLDERGKSLTSPEFSRFVAAWRDDGVASAAFVVGGADGLDPEFVAQADMRLSFGRLVWPHMLARVMLSEQLYRMTQILAGTPYHRD